ncbi:MAG TPA: hypothetical protein DCP32_10955 [Anaerolineaceae bacterium]|nr:hypothetical protein [Anaerolineaceae bacterium]HBA91939.1 hypothetical protein [Anaerolineaceae bacterium]
MFNFHAMNQFYAKGELTINRSSFPAELNGQYKSYSNDAVQLDIWTDAKEAPDLFKASITFPFTVSFLGKTEQGDPIQLLGIRSKTTNGFNHLEGDANIFIKGDIDAVVSPGESLSIYSIVSPTSLIYPDWTYSKNYDGTITKFGTERERIGIPWNINNGTARLIDRYEYVDGNDNDENVTLRIQTNALVLTIHPEVETEIKAIFLQLQKLMFEDLSLLSFIGRKRISLIEVNAMLEVDGKVKSAFARYRSWGGFYNLPSDKSQLRQLIRPRSLQDGVFKSLVENYRISPFKSVIDRTIPYLLTSYEDGYVETHLINAYASLESMVDGIGSKFSLEFLLGNNPFKRLSRKIEDLVHEVVKDDENANGIIKKIPELRRRSFLDRLLFLLNEQGVNTKLIWPRGTDERVEFHKLLKRRNLLIHTGTIDQDEIWRFDLNRVQKLVELWILKLLDCPEDAISEYSLWRGAPIHKILHY